MAEKKVRLKNKSGDYLYPYTDNVPAASEKVAGIVKFDSAATSKSANVLTSGVIYTALSGKLATSGTAAKAAADASGNNIVSTYATKSELNSVKSSLATDSNVVHKSGNETINGVKTFTSAVVMPASAAANSVVTTTGLSKGANGYFKFGNGLIIQWGTAGSGGTVTLPTAFSTADYSVVVTRVNADTKYHGGSYLQTLTTTNFTFNGASANGSPHKWIAVGY